MIHKYAKGEARKNDVNRERHDPIIHSKTDLQSQPRSEIPTAPFLQRLSSHNQSSCQER